jgi:GNAT superfamily N-acetyltransferase
VPRLRGGVRAQAPGPAVSPTQAELEDVPFELWPECWPSRRSCSRTGAGGGGAVLHDVFEARAHPCCPQHGRHDPPDRRREFPAYLRANEAVQRSSDGTSSVSARQRTTAAAASTARRSSARRRVHDADDRPGGSSDGYVTAVGVKPTHRRRGIATRLMRRQLDQAHERGELVDVLYASEGGIYGRFGYGLASFALAFDMESSRSGFVASYEPSGTVRLVELADAVEDVLAVHAEVRPSRPGMVGLDRPRLDYALHGTGRRAISRGSRFCTRATAAWTGTRSTGCATTGPAGSRTRSSRSRPAGDDRGRARGPVALPVRRRPHRTGPVVEPPGGRAARTPRRRARRCGHPVGQPVSGWWTSARPRAGGMPPPGASWWRCAIRSDPGTTVGTRSMRGRMGGDGGADDRGPDLACTASDVGAVPGGTSPRQFHRAYRVASTRRGPRPRRRDARVIRRPGVPRVLTAPAPQVRPRRSATGRARRAPSRASPSTRRNRSLTRCAGAEQHHPRVRQRHAHKSAAAVASEAPAAPGGGVGSNAAPVVARNMYAGVEDHRDHAAVDGWVRARPHRSAWCHFRTASTARAQRRPPPPARPGGTALPAGARTARPRARAA